MVDHRTQLNPNDLNYYYFVQPPAERSSSNPKGFHIDGKMMPQRDIDDKANGTDTWKILRGEDVTFFAEAAWERRYAAHQFDGTFSSREQHKDEPFPISVPISRITSGKIDGYQWQYQIGNWTSGSVPSGIADCFYEHFLDIKQASELKDSYTKWPDGSEIEAEVSNGRWFEPSYWHPSWAMGGFTPPMMGKSVSDVMESDLADFATNKPLSADAVRKAYYDLRKLRFYTLLAGWWESIEGDYYMDATSPTWKVAAHDEEHLNPPSVPTHLPNSNYVLYDTGWYFSTDPVQKAWCQCEATSGTFRLPYCGKYGRGQGYKSQMFGNEVACYVALKLDWVNEETDWEMRTRIGFYKVPYVVRTDVGKVNVNYSDVVSKAKAFADLYNARANSFSESHEHLKFCSVAVCAVFTVCQIGSRTDISSLNWDWTPTNNNNTSNANNGLASVQIKYLDTNTLEAAIV